MQELEQRREQLPPAALRHYLSSSGRVFRAPSPPYAAIFCQKAGGQLSAAHPT